MSGVRLHRELGLEFGTISTVRTRTFYKTDDVPRALKAAHKTEAAKMKKLSKIQKAGEKDKTRPTLSRRQNRGQRVR